jgi:hypothetical protein
MVDADREWALSHTHSCEGLTQVDADKVTRLDEARRAHWEDNVDPLKAYLSSIGVFPPSCAKVALLWTSKTHLDFMASARVLRTVECASSRTSSRTCSSCGCQSSTSCAWDNPMGKERPQLAR